MTREKCVLIVAYLLSKLICTLVAVEMGNFLFAFFTPNGLEIRYIVMTNVTQVSKITNIGQLQILIHYIYTASLSRYLYNFIKNLIAIRTFVLRLTPPVVYAFETELVLTFDDGDFVHVDFVQAD